MVTQYVPARHMPERVGEFLARMLPGAPAPSAPHVADLLSDLTAADVSAWVALTDGRIRAVFGARLRHVTPADPEYTYMPARYALVPMSMWHVTGDAWSYAPGLLDHIARDAAGEGIDRLSIEIPLEHAAGIAVMLDAGFTPDVILAARATRPGVMRTPPGVEIRRAEERDAQALLDLTLEEADYHAAHTDSGIIADQDPEPSQAFVREWLDNQRTKNVPTFVAETDDGVVGMLPLMHIAGGEDHRLPAPYGYVASTCVTAGVRGTGVGKALVEHALDAAHERGFKVLMLHYIADNPLAGPFWEGFGFEPITVTLTRVGLNGGERKGEHGGVTD